MLCPHTPTTVSNFVQKSDIEGYNSEASGSSSEPRNFRLLSEIYDSTEEIEILDELLLIGVEEPKTFEDAKNGKEWYVAMRAKIETIDKNNTWVLTDLPASRKPTSPKWVYKIKKDTNGDILKYKSTLLARGYVQKKGVNYDEVFCAYNSH